MKSLRHIERINGIGTLRVPEGDDREVAYGIDVYQTVEHITTLGPTYQSVDLLKSCEVRLSGLDEWDFTADEGTLTLQDGRTIRLLLTNPIKALGGIETHSI